MEPQPHFVWEINAISIAHRVMMLKQDMQCGGDAFLSRAQRAFALTVLRPEGP